MNDIDLKLTEPEEKPDPEEETRETPQEELREEPQEEPQKAPARRKKGFGQFILGLLCGMVLLAVIQLVQWGYYSIPFGSRGILTFRLPSSGTAAGSGSLDVNKTVQKMQEIQYLLDRAYLYKQDPQMVSDGIFTGMLAGVAVEDKYARYYSVSDYESENKRMNGSYDGIGVTVSTDPETGGLLVQSVNSRGPAKKAGIRVDDIIIRADGADLTHISLDEAVSDHVTGPPGTSVELVILRGEEEIEMTVPRETILDITVRGEMLPGTSTGYVSITSFNRQTETEFRELWKELKSGGAENVVIDLRNNGGGDMDVALRMLDLLLADSLKPETVQEGAPAFDGRTLLLSVEDKNGKASHYFAHDGQGEVLPIVVLVNERSASASEIFTGVLMSYGARSVGEKTYGKGIVQTVYQLSDNSAVKFTTNEYRLPNGSLIHGTGITPDVELSFEEYGDVTSARVNYAGGEETDLAGDNQLKEALRLLNGD